MPLATIGIILALVIVGLVGFGSVNFGGSTRSIGKVGETEIDAGLGNGGLGRLAACFMDSSMVLTPCPTSYPVSHNG